MVANVLELLGEALPAGRVTVSEDAVAAAGRDFRGSEPSGRALVLVRPESTAEVSAVLAAANSTATPVVAQGSRTSIHGSALGSEGAILLDVSRMNRILSIDRLDRVVRVQPGVLVGDLQRAVAAEGLFYAPDPASAEIASVGGTIAMNAGGMRCIKYGVTRDAVRSLEVVLADGQVVRTRPATVKWTTGLDLTGLIVGSEGTLGVATEAALSLWPTPGPERGVAATFPSLAQAFEAADRIVEGRRLPSTLEFLDEVALAGIRIVRPDLGVSPDAKAWLLAVTDEWENPAAHLDEFEAVMWQCGALSLERGEDEAALARLFETRRNLLPGVDALRGGAIHGDVAVPRAALLEFAEHALQIAADTGLLVSLSGHIGDGNLHPTVLYDSAVPGELERAQEANSSLLRVAIDLGGALAGEHGVGSDKLGLVDFELEPRVRQLQRAVKDVFDPVGILNPGRKL